MMPQALVEGTAVWVESRLGEEGIGSPGRLNDPAALETVRLERARGQSRSLWDVSGLVDFYGAGNLPYLYGGLFADFFKRAVWSGHARTALESLIRWQYF
jgi:hypothetical protein